MLDSRQLETILKHAVAEELFRAAENLLAEIDLRPGGYPDAAVIRLRKIVDRIKDA
jgi:hypothetical protein